MCRGTPVTASQLPMMMGLSPRVRGNPHRTHHRYPRARSIPACAGEPCRRPAKAGLGTVYPRVCGGTDGTTPSDDREYGLSPRVRGNRSAPAPPGTSARSIPACAGEPGAGGAGAGRGRVYPRVCGGTPCSLLRCRTVNGLSPRVRGNQAPDTIARLWVRSIPACAGEPAQRYAFRRGSRVYPRVCGGTAYRNAPPGQTTGLSPRVRGNPPAAETAGVSLRSIPACAGEPVHAGVPGRLCGVYPRVCGGTAGAGNRLMPALGLSPRVRGNPMPCCG